jgi:hypothetical protein
LISYADKLIGYEEIPELYFILHTHRDSYATLLDVFPFVTPHSSVDIHVYHCRALIFAETYGLLYIEN